MKTEISRITKNFSALFSAQVIYKILSFFVMVMMARFLGVQGFGEFSYGLSFVWAFLFLSDWGMEELFVRDVASNQGLIDKYINNIVTLRILIAVLAYLLIILLVYLFVPKGIKFWIILILGASIILDSSMYFFRCLFRAREKMEYEAGLMIVEIFLKLLAVFLVTRMNINISGPILISLAMLCVSLINLVFNFGVFVLKNKVPQLRIDLDFWFYLLRNGLPFAVIYILGMINFRINTILLSIMKSDETAGIYSANFKLLEQVFLIPLTISYVLLPVFSRLVYSRDKIRRLFTIIIPFLIFLGIAGLAVCYAIGKPIIILIYGKSFESAGNYFGMLSWVLIPFFLKPIFEKMLYGFRKQTFVLIMYLSGALLNIGFNFVLIPRRGIEGVALGTMFSETITIIGCMILLVKLLFLPTVTRLGLIKWRN